MATQTLKKWNMVRLGDLAKISSGGTPSRKHLEYYSDTGHLWIKSKELLDRAIDNSEEKITDLGLKKSSAKYFDPQTVLLAMYGANVGQLGWIKKPATVNQAIAGIQVKKEIADPLFVFYSLMSGRDALTTQAFGAAQQNLNQDLIKNFEISIPSLPTQKQIADILSTYDDLVENNNHRIRILEDIAQKTYYEWFVDFRFLGHEKIKFGVGGLPEGWEIKKIREIGRVVTGKTPPTSNKDNQGDYMPFIKTPDLHDSVFCISTNESLSIQGVETQKNKIIPKNSIVVSCIGTVGVVGITVRESQTNQQINSIIPVEFNIREYLYFVCVGLRQHLKNIGANGATMGNVNKEKFETIEILLPNNETLDAFHEIASDLFEEILALLLQNQNLKKSRDLLIPQLVTGKLEINI